MYKFDDKEEYLKVMITHLSSIGMPSDVSSALAADIADGMKRIPKGMGLTLPRTSWVIRDDDLRLMETLWGAVLAAASVDFFYKSLTASAITGMLAASFRLICAARAKGVYLTRLQHRLILALKASDAGLTVSDLALRVNAMSEQGEEVLTEKEVLHQLSNLTKIRLADGNVVALVAEDSQGLWSSSGL